MLFGGVEPRASWYVTNYTKTATTGQIQRGGQDMDALSCAVLGFRPVVALLVL